MAEAPQWLVSLVDLVGNRMEPHSATGPLAFRWRQEGDFWEIAVYYTPGEVIGGAEDGAVVVPGFSLDVQELISAFEKVAGVCWRSHSFGPHDSLGPHISIEGVYQGHEVWLQILAEAPEDEEPGFKVDL
jgi:hypothetical protein